MFESFTRTKFTSLIEKDPNSIYDIKYDSLIIDIYSGDVKVINFSITPRQHILDSLQKNNIPRKFVIDFKMGDFKLHNIELIKFLKGGDIEVDAIRFKNIEGEVYVNDTLKLRNTTTLSDDILSNSFISALIHEVEIQNGSFKWFNTTSDTINVLSFENFNLNIEELYSDTAMMKKVRGVTLEEMHFSFGNLQNKLIKNYTVTSDRISFNSEENIYSATNTQMIPSQEKVDSRNFFKLQISQIDLAGINYDSLIQKDLFLINKVFIKEPNFTYIRPPQHLQKDTLRFLPAVTFKNIPIPIRIDSIQIHNGYLNYLKHGYGEPLLSFDISRILVNGYNFTSDPGLMEPSKTFNVGGSLLFFKETPVYMNFTFLMTDLYNSYKIHGVIDTLHGESLNQIIKNPFKIRVQSGTFNKMTFNINGNDTVAIGDFKVDYTDLKLEALTINEKDFTDVKRKGFNTFLVNTLARKKNDPVRSSFNEGIIYLDRDDHQTFLDFNLSALMNGLVTSVIPESKGFIVPKEERKALKQEQKEEKKDQRKEGK